MEDTTLGLVITNIFDKIKSVEDNNASVARKIDTVNESVSKIAIALEKITQIERDGQRYIQRVDGIDREVDVLKSDRDKAMGAISFLKWLLGISGGCVFTFIIWLSSQTVNTQVWIAKTDEWKITVMEKLK